MKLMADVAAEIALPADQVFEYVIDLTRFAQWFPGALQVVSDDALGVDQIGKCYREELALPGRGTIWVELEVVDVETGQRLVTEGGFELLRPRMQIDVTALNDQRCNVRWRMHSREGRRARPLLLWLLSLILRRRARLGLEALNVRVQEYYRGIA